MRAPHPLRPAGLPGLAAGRPGPVGSGPVRGGERARMPRGWRRTRFWRRIPPPGYARSGEAVRAARRPPLPRGRAVAPARRGGGGAARWGCPGSRVGPAEELRRGRRAPLAPPSPPPRFRGASGAAAAAGWSSRRGPARPWGGDGSPGGSPARPASPTASCFGPCSCCLLVPGTGGGQPRALALLLALWDRRSLTAGPAAPGGEADGGRPPDIAGAG